MKKLARYEFSSIQKDDGYGTLRVFDVNEVPFPVKRICSVSAGEGVVRGRHAHKQRNQLLIRVSSSIELLCKDGEQTASFILDEKNGGIWVANGVWAEQTYLQDRSVLCDQPYDEGDYIRDYQAFFQWKSETECVFERAVL